MTLVKPHLAQFPQREFAGTIIGLCFSATPVCLKYSWDVDEFIMFLYRRASSSLTRVYRERFILIRSIDTQHLGSVPSVVYLIIFND